MPADLSPTPPPPHGPELDPVERVREHPRDRRLSRRVLAGGHRAVVDAARAAWNALPAEPGRPHPPTSLPSLPAPVTTPSGRCKATSAAACW